MNNPVRKDKGNVHDCAQNNTKFIFKLIAKLKIRISFKMAWDKLTDRPFD